MEKKKDDIWPHLFIPIEFALELVLATDFSYSATFTQELNILDVFCVFLSCICST